MSFNTVAHMFRFARTLTMHVRNKEQARQIRNPSLERSYQGSSSNVNGKPAIIDEEEEGRWDKDSDLFPVHEDQRTAKASYTGRQYPEGRVLRM